MKPTWDETGEPINLLAASLDALEWLKMFSRMIDEGKLTTTKREQFTDNRKRLANCVKALEGFITVSQLPTAEARGLAPDADSNF